MKVLKQHILISFIFLCILALPTFAQSPSDIRLQVISAIEIKSTEWETVVVELENLSTIKFEGVLEVELPQGMEIIGLTKLPIQIDPNKKRFQPIRIRASKSLKAGLAEVQFKLKQNDSLLAQAVTAVSIPSTRRVRAFAVDPNVFMQHVGDSIKFDVQIVNHGNQDEEVHVVVNLPKDLEYGEGTTSSLQVPAFTDTVFTYAKKIDKRMMQLEHFSVRIAVVNKEDEFVGSAVFQVQNIASQRRYSDPSDVFNLDRLWNRNQIGFGVRNIGEVSQSYNLKARADLPFEEDRLRLNLDALWWEQSNADPRMTNTWIAYETNEMGVRLGNIQDYDSDMYINGRGISVTSKNIIDENSELQLGIVEKSNNLLDKTFNIKQEGFNVFAKLTDIHSNKINQSFFYVFDKSIDGEVNLIQDRLQWLPNKNWRINVTGSLANKKYNAPINTNKISGAVDMDYMGRMGSYRIQGRNSWSSPYYPGQRRGLLLFNNGISKQIKQHRLFLNTNYYKNNQKFMTFRRPSNRQKSYSINGGFGSRIGAVQFSVSPEYYNEDGLFYTFSDDLETEMNMENFNFHTKLSILLNKSGQSIVANISNGISRLSYYTSAKFINRTNVSWNYNGFSTNVGFQQGGFYLSETAYPYLFNNQAVIKRLIISQGFYKNFFKNKFQLNGQLTYQNDKIYGNSWSYNAMGNLKLTRHLDFYMGFQGYTHETSQNFNQNIYMQAGVNVKLPYSNQNILSKAGAINVFVYYDNNNNNQYDEGDLPASSEMVQINNVNFITDSKGRVSYNKLPYGDYRIRANASKWYSETENIFLSTKKAEVNIPLQATGALRGKIDIEKLTIHDKQITGTLGRIHIVLTDPNGKRWIAKTDDNGSFSIYLPVNTYEVYIPKEHLPKETNLKEYPKTLDIVQSQTTLLETITLKANKRDIEVKRFKQ